MVNEKRLIDANELKRKLVELGGEPDYQHPDEDWGVGVCMAEGIVDEMPTVDAVEVVHGQWVISCDGYYPYCSACKEEPMHGEMTNYCPNCGAKMDGGNEDG